MQEDRKLQPKHQENEVDLGVFFDLLGKIVKKIGSAFKAVFLYIFEFFLIILLFIKRKIIWLAIGALIGLGFGLYRYATEGPSYHSEMVVRTNFKSSRLLYNKIDYYNSLIKENRVADLSVVFGLSKQEAQKLIRFEIAPVDDDVEAAKLYKSTFLDDRRADMRGADTLWAKTMKFEEFKEQLSSYDYPLHEITLYSSQADVYPKVEQGILRSFADNKVLEQVKQATVNMLQNEEDILQRSLSGLDSLRHAYNKKISEGRGAGTSGANSLFVSDNNPSNPEIDLYDKELIFKDELIKVKVRAIDQQNILQVYSGFNPTGTKSAGFKQDFFRFTWIGFLIVFVGLLFSEVYKYLDRIDQKRKLARTEA